MDEQQSASVSSTVQIAQPIFNSNRTNGDKSPGSY